MPVAKFTNRERVEVLKRWACSPSSHGYDFGTDLGVGKALAKQWIGIYMEEDRAIYRPMGVNRVEWEKSNARAMDDIFNTPENYWKRPSHRTGRLPKQTANTTRINGGVLCVFDSCTIGEMNQMLVALGGLDAGERV